MEHSSLLSARNKALHARMRKLGIREQDIAENFVRSSGRGGQNVNKVSTCVQIRHMPTATEVKCSEARSQSANRVRAREILVEKIKAVRMAEELERKGLVNKARKSRWKRSGRAKERVLAGKKIRSEKKRSRGRVNASGE